MSIYLVSNRKRLGEALDDSMLAKASNVLSFGKVNLAQDPKKSTISLLNSSGIWSPISMGGANTNLSQGPTDTLLYIHGYNTSLSKALENLAILYKHYVSPGSRIKHVVGYIWPSNGNIIAYKGDLNDAQKSGQIFFYQYQTLINGVSSLLKIDHADFNGRFYLMLHSMGTYVFQEAMKVYSEQQIAKREYFDHAILVGSDVSYRAFASDIQPLNLLRELAGHVTIYWNQYDKVLMLSDIINDNRLGQLGPIHKNQFGVSSIDVSSVAGVGINNGTVHGYHLDNKETINDIRQFLSGVPANEIVGREKLGDNEYRVTSHHHIV